MTQGRAIFCFWTRAGARPLLSQLLHRGNNKLIQGQMEGIALYQGAVSSYQSGETSGLTAVGLGPSPSLRTGKLAMSLIPRSLQLKRASSEPTGPLFDHCAQPSRMLSEDPRVKQFNPFQEHFHSSFCNSWFGRLHWRLLSASEHSNLCCPSSKAEE
jgi:hypothetical protein